MKKLLPLLLMLLLLTGCSADPLLPVTTNDPSAQVPSPTAAPEKAWRQESATLWFRFGSEALLAPESRVLSLSPTAPYEFSLLQALVSGPSASSPELRSLFPPGTQILSTQRHDRRLFVTFSRQIMNAYADEPDNWGSSEFWRTEAPLRRELAMQAIAATVTENCDVDEVVILVEQQQVTNSLRLRQSYYLTGSDSVSLADPLTRDETLLLTHRRCMEIILECWSTRDWQRLHQYTAAFDPSTGLQRPDEAAFADQMARLPHLTEYTVSFGSVSADGQQAVFSLTGRCMQDGSTIDLNNAVIRLHQENGQWRIAMSQLTVREVSE